jgi:hypothetical protein
MTRTVRWAEGDMEYVGVLKNDMASEPIKSSEYVPVRIAFDKKGCLYDVRQGKCLGQKSEISTSIAPAIAHLYAILPYKVKGVYANPAGPYGPGDAVAIEVGVKADTDRPGNHVLHVEFIGPDKEARPYYSQNLKTEKGKATVRIPTALNDSKGRWTIRVKDVASGMETDERFVLK